MKRNKDYFKRYNKYPAPNPFSMNQRKIAAAALKLEVVEFVRLQMLAVENKKNLWDVLVENNVLTPEGELK